MTILQPLSVKQFLVTLEGLKSFFTKITAPSETRGETEYNDGQTGFVRTHLDFTKLEKVTLSKPFDAKQDNELLDWIKETLKTDRVFSVSVQPVNADVDGTPIDGSRTMLLTKCRLVKATYPEADRVGSGLAMVVIEVIPEAITFQ